MERVASTRCRGIIAAAVRGIDVGVPLGSTCAVGAETEAHVQMLQK